MANPLSLTHENRNSPYYISFEQTSSSSSGEEIQTDSKIPIQGKTKGKLSTSVVKYKGYASFPSRVRNLRSTTHAWKRKELKIFFQVPRLLYKGWLGIYLKSQSHKYI